VAVVLLALLIVFVTWVVLLAAAVATLRWALRRSNRVDPSRATAAPLAWLWSPTEPARLHRRLRTAVRASQPLTPDRRSERGPSLSVDELRRDLAHQAALIDDRVVLAARQPRHARRSQLYELRRQVAALEALSVRIAALGRPDGAPASGWDESPEAAIARIGHTLDLLDDAHRELSELERCAHPDGLAVIEEAVDRDRTARAAAAPLPRPAGRIEVLGAHLARSPDRS